jgi:hypothetical protein
MLPRRSAATEPAAQPAFLLRGAILSARCCRSAALIKMRAPYPHVQVCRMASAENRKLAYSTLTSLVVPALTRHDSPWICSQTTQQVSYHA